MSRSVLSESLGAVRLSLHGTLSTSKCRSLSKPVSHSQKCIAGAFEPLFGSFTFGKSKSTLLKSKRTLLESKSTLLSSKNAPLKSHTLRLPFKIHIPATVNNPPKRTTNLSATSPIAGIVGKVSANLQSDFGRSLLRPIAAMMLVMIAMFISWQERVGLEKEMLVAVVRSYVQLIGIGFALQLVFAQKSAALSLLSISVMVLVAGYTAGQRAKAVPGSFSIATISILVATSICTTVLVLLRVFPFEPRYIIPIAGNITGNAMNVTGVTMKRLREDLHLQRLEVEAALALGATPRQASLTQLRRALTTGMSPIVDLAKTTGIVSLPGAMTGLIMAGASPLEAVQLQLVVVYMLIGAATFSGLTAAYLSQGKFFTAAYQLRLSDASPQKSSDSNPQIGSEGLLMDQSKQPNSPSTRSATSTKARLLVRSLSYSSPNQERILDDVSFEVPRGKILGLIGPSGSGKSTVLRALNRLLEPGKGHVLFDGVDIRDLDVVKLRRRVGALFQTAALFDGTVAENIRYGPKLHGKVLTDSEVANLLQKVGLEPELATTSALELSGGQAQRVSLARTLANEPDCLLLDEPTSMLDPAATRLVEETLLKLREETGLTMVLVSHSVDQIKRLADDVCLLVKGRVVESGTIAELFESEHTLSQDFLAGTLKDAQA